MKQTAAIIIIIVLVALGTAPSSPDASVDSVTERQPWRFVLNDQEVKKGDDGGGGRWVAQVSFPNRSVFPCYSDRSRDSAEHSPFFFSTQSASLCVIPYCTVGKFDLVSCLFFFPYSKSCMLEMEKKVGAGICDCSVSGSVIGNICFLLVNEPSESARLAAAAVVQSCGPQLQ